MTKSHTTAPGPSTDPAFLARLRAATAVLEELVADRSLLVGVPPDDQRRLLQAAGQVYSPDAIARRRLVRATMRQRKATKVRREEGVLDATGIRALRRKPVYTSPNVFPPVEFEQRDAADDPDAREPIEPQH